MGVLGYTYQQVMSQPIGPLRDAIKAHGKWYDDLFGHLFGSPRTDKIQTPSARSMTPALFDALFMGKKQ